MADKIYSDKIQGSACQVNFLGTMWADSNGQSFQQSRKILFSPWPPTTKGYLAHFWTFGEVLEIIQFSVINALDDLKEWSFHCYQEAANSQPSLLNVGFWPL